MHGSYNHTWISIRTAHVELMRLSLYIKTNNSVLCGTRSPGRMQTGVSIRVNRSNKVVIFTHPYIRDLYPKNNKLAVEVPVYDGRLSSKFEVNCASHF